MIGSANDTSYQRVRLRDEYGLVSDDGMAIEMRRRPGGRRQTGGGPYRGAAEMPRRKLFHVVDVVETSVALVDAPGDAAVRGQLTQALLQRHSVAVFFDASAPGVGVLGVASRALEVEAAVMVAARAAAVVKVCAQWDESRAFVFVAREAAPGRVGHAHHVCAEAAFRDPNWQVTAYRPVHEWPFLRARFGGGAVVGVDVDGTRAFGERHDAVRTDLMLARVEGALRGLGAQMGATFARGRGDEFVLAIEYAKGPALGEAALDAIRALAIPDGAGGTVTAHVGVIPGAPAATVPERLEAAVSEAARATGERVRVHLA